MTVIAFGDIDLIKHISTWKLMKVKLLLTFNMNLGIPISSTKSTLRIMTKFSFCKSIVTRKGSAMSFSFTFSSLHESIQSFWIKTSVSSSFVLHVEECFHFVGVGGAGCVGTKIGLKQLVNTEGGFKGISFP